MNTLTEVAVIASAFWFIVIVIVGAWYVLGKDDDWCD